MHHFQPFVYAEKNEDGRFLAISAVRLHLIAAYELIVTPNEHPIDYITGLLKRQVDFILALENPGLDCAFDLRWVTYPQPDKQIFGTIEIGLLIRVTDTEKSHAEESVKKITYDTWSLLSAGFREYEFEIVTEKQDFEKIYQPFSFQHFAEIVHREYQIPLDSPIPFPYKKNIGFLKREGKKKQGAKNLAHTYYVFPFLNTLNTWHRFAHAALLQPHPILVSIGLKPTRLSEDEHQALNNVIIKCEHDLQFPPVHDQENEQQMGLTLYSYTQAFREAVSTQLLRLEDACFLMRIQMCSTKAISKAIIDSLGMEITDVVGEHTLETQPVLLQHLVGGFDVYFPRKTHEKLTVRRNLQHLEHDTWIETLAPKSLRRWRYLVEPKEANAAFRFPVPQAQDFPGLETKLSRTAPTLGAIPKSGLLLGVNYHSGYRREVRISAKDRLRHLYALGQTGTGKTTFFESLIMQDLQEGNGLCVLDPHGDLVERILPKIPAKRLDDVILFDASEREKPFGLNLIEWQNENHKYFIVQEMLAIIRRLIPNPEMRGPVFEHFVRMVILTLMANPGDPGTLVEFPRMIIDRAYHHRWLPHVKDPLVRYFWDYEYKSMANYQISDISGYVISKFDGFIIDPLMRNIIGQRTSSLDFTDILANKKILLVNLAKGRLGEINSNLLGMILVSKFQAAAFSGAIHEGAKNGSYYLYVDEFHNIATDNFTVLLSEARKFGLSLVITNQFLSQLIDIYHKTTIIDAILGNVGTLACFRVGITDAEYLLPKFLPVFSKKDLLNLPNFEFYVASSIEGEVTKPYSLRLMRDKTPPNPAVARAVRRNSLVKYGRPRKTVERELLKSIIWQTVKADTKK